jgi:hypothetical protein
LNIEYINVGWDALLAGVAGCQYDAAISAMTITEERCSVPVLRPVFERRSDYRRARQMKMA